MICDVIQLACQLRQSRFRLAGPAPTPSSSPPRSRAPPDTPEAAGRGRRPTLPTDTIRWSRTWPHRRSLQRLRRPRQHCPPLPLPSSPPYPIYSRPWSMGPPLRRQMWPRPGSTTTRGAPVLPIICVCCYSPCSTTRSFGHFINGKWYMPEGKRNSYESRNSVNGSRLATTLQGTTEDLEIAIQSAKSAYVSWSNLPPHVRAR